MLVAHSFGLLGFAPHYGAAEPSCIACDSCQLSAVRPALCRGILSSQVNHHRSILLSTASVIDGDAATFTFSSNQKSFQLRAASVAEKVPLQRPFVRSHSIVRHCPYSPNPADWLCAVSSQPEYSSMAYLQRLLHGKLNTRHRAHVYSYTACSSLLGFALVAS